MCPTFEYLCEDCKIVFEETLIDPDEVKEYASCHPCKNCSSIAKRVAISLVNFQFKGTPGHSGSHDLDYPTLDKAVGRSSASKWEDINRRKEAADKVRRETGVNAINTAGTQPAPADPNVLKLRQAAMDAGVVKKAEPVDKF